VWRPAQVIGGGTQRNRMVWETSSGSCFLFRCQRGTRGSSSSCLPPSFCEWLTWCSPIHYTSIIKRKKKKKKFDNIHIININLNILQIYLYIINIYFRLGSVGFDNIHILLIIYWVQKIIIYSGQISIHRVQIKFLSLIKVLFSKKKINNI